MANINSKSKRQLEFFPNHQ